MIPDASCLLAIPLLAVFICPLSVLAEGAQQNDRLTTPEEMRK